MMQNVGIYKHKDELSKLVGISMIISFLLISEIKIKKVPKIVQNRIFCMTCSTA